MAVGPEAVNRPGTPSTVQIEIAPDAVEPAGRATRAIARVGGLRGALDQRDSPGPLDPGRLHRLFRDSDGDGAVHIGRGHNAGSNARHHR